MRWTFIGAILVFVVVSSSAHAQTKGAAKGQAKATPKVETKPQAQPAGRPDLSRVVIPDDKSAALAALKEWLAARGLEVEDRQGTLLMRRSGVLMNLIAVPTAGELDRIRVITFYNPKDEFKGGKEMEELAVKLNKSQNFFQVFVDDDGDLGAGGSITFVDELTAKVFDAYVDAFAQIVKRYVLTDEAVKLLK
jgi:hypothetical protein